MVGVYRKKDEGRYGCVVDVSSWGRGRKERRKKKEEERERGKKQG